MGTARGKKILFSIDQFVIMIAWLASLFAILYFRAYHLIAASVSALILLNLAIGAWIHHNVGAHWKKGYKQYLFIQTIFLAIWCPLLMLILVGERLELISVWVAVLLVFYFGLGIASKEKLVEGIWQAKKSEKRTSH